MINAPFTALLDHPDASLTPYSDVWLAVNDAATRQPLEYGVNAGQIANEIAPFGGPGSGREGSQAGIDEYRENKYLCMDISSAGI